MQMTNLPESIWANEGDQRVEYVRKTKLAETDDHRRKVIAENERLLNALIENNRRIAALEAQLAERVKPLEWGPYHNPVFAGPDIAVASFSVFGLQLYQAQRDPQGTGFIVFLAPKYGTEFWSSKGHADLDEAKAAAQADFDRRIISALEVTPPEAGALKNEQSAPEGQQEPVAWRWKPKNSEMWIYDPKPEWLEAQSRDEIDAEPLYTRPSEQAVTREMVNAAYNTGKDRCMTGAPNDFRAVLKSALTAAQEAGKP